MQGAAEVGSTANRYQIFAKLAVGGMAELFLARGASVAGVERYCVLKRILRERASDEQFVRMFVDEARLAAQLQHPNIASVYDVGMLGDSYFFTMEYVHGETVRALLQRAGHASRKLPLACVLTIIAGAASGLHHAHERNAHDGRPLGIVHRDVSPSNLMVSFEGNTKLVDFGVAKAADRAIETQSGTVKGKISYLSPEQCRGNRVDRRSDLFSLGIVMWEMLTGARLYRRPSDFENMTAIVHEPPPRPSQHRAEIPRAIDDIVLKLLAKDLADRYQTADQVVEAIENASMRAGTILSGSAVSRLMRDLFGTRVEPWLELDLEAASHERATVMAKPVPVDTNTGSTDSMDPVLDSVPDLSVSTTDRTRELSDDDLDELETAQVSPAEQLAAIQIARAPARRASELPTLIPDPPPAPGPTQSPVPGRVPGRGPTPLTPLPFDPRVVAQPTIRLSQGAVIAGLPFAPAKPAGASGSTLLGVGARSAPSGQSGPQPMLDYSTAFSPTIRLAPSGPRALPPPPEMPTSSDLIALQDQFRASGPVPRLTPRRATPIIAVVVVMVAIGVIATVIAMRGPELPAPRPAPHEIAPVHMEATPR